jgi:hypothetical protein
MKMKVATVFTAVLATASAFAPVVNNRPSNPLFTKSQATKSTQHQTFHQRFYTLENAGACLPKKFNKAVRPLAICTTLACGLATFLASSATKEASCLMASAHVHPIALLSLRGGASIWKYTPGMMLKTQVVSLGMLTSFFLLAPVFGRDPYKIVGLGTKDDQKHTLLLGALFYLEALTAHAAFFTTNPTLVCKFSAVPVGLIYLLNIFDSWKRKDQFGWFKHIFPMMPFLMYAYLGFAV